MRDKTSETRLVDVKLGADFEVIRKYLKPLEVALVNVKTNALIDNYGGGNDSS